MSHIAHSKSSIAVLKKDPKGRLSTFELHLTDTQENRLTGLLDKYVVVLKGNINRRFDGDLPIVSAFSIFNPLTWPPLASGAFKKHGTKQVKTLAVSFFKVIKKRRVMKKRRQSKSSCCWSGRSLSSTCIPGGEHIPEEVKESYLETATKCCLKRVISP